MIGLTILFDDVGLVASSFLDDTATQLTYYGLQQLADTVTPNKPFVFFRNNHVSVCLCVGDRLICHCINVLDFIVFHVAQTSRVIRFIHVGDRFRAGITEISSVGELRRYRSGVIRIL